MVARVGIIDSRSTGSPVTMGIGSPAPARRAPRAHLHRVVRRHIDQHRARRGPSELGTAVKAGSGAAGRDDQEGCSIGLAQIEVRGLISAWSHPIVPRRPHGLCEDFIMVDALWKNQRVLVTGGAGFIGSHLTRCLVDASAEVMFWMICRPIMIAGSAAAELIVGSVECRSTVEQAAADCTAIIHLAARVSVPQAEQDPDGRRRVNVEGRPMRRPRRWDGPASCWPARAVYGDPIDSPRRRRRSTCCRSTASPRHRPSRSCWMRSSRQVQASCLRLFNVVGRG